MTNRGTLRTACGSYPWLYVFAAVVTNEGFITTCDNRSGTVSLADIDAVLVNTASGQINPGVTRRRLDLPVINEGTITIGAGRHVTVTLFR